MKNFLAIASLAIFLSACGSGDGDGLPSVTIGTVNGVDVTYVGTVTATSPKLSETGTCKIPDIAMYMPASQMFSPMKYFVSTSNVLDCSSTTMGTALWNQNVGQGTLGGLTCQELAADIPDALQQISKTALCTDPFSGLQESPCTCCVMVTRLDSGYFKGEGVVCGGVGPQGVLCSIAGEFMGWACT